MARSALQIVQDAALKLSVDQPDALFASTDRTELELAEALIEAADKIVHAHDWTKLKKIHTHTGDGTTTDFAPPDDYLRMPKDAGIWSDRLLDPLTPITPEEWLRMDVNAFDTIDGTWTTYGGNFVYRPALAADETARFWYVSGAFADEMGTVKDRFDSDSDTFLLDDRVLELMLVWVWRTQKGMDYAEDLQSGEIALARAIERDKGPRVLKQRRSARIDATLAYPRPLNQ